MKNLKDYLHLYLGCEVRCNERISEAKKITLAGYTTLAAGIAPENYVRVQLHTSGDNLLWLDADQVKLVLRPLSDMTEEEAAKCDELSGGIFTTYSGRGEEIKYLLSRSFDLFGLIEAGLAIDKTKLKS